MFMCKVCNKEFELKSQLAGHSNSHTKTKKRIAYENEPKLCKNCEHPIPYLSYTNHNDIEYCSQSCRAKYFHKNHLLVSKKRQN